MTKIERIEPYYLGFQCETKERMTWTAQPSIPYSPRGLMVWGADTTTRIHRFQVGNIQALCASAEPIPALIFESILSFEEFSQLVVESSVTRVVTRYREGVLKDLPRQFPWAKLAGYTLSIGHSWTFETSGPIAAVVSWGWGDVS